MAPTSGNNVWCAAAGGHLTTHQVITALKTSGVAERVRHRRAILPQLAATDVVGRDVMRRCRWRVRFGPVHAEDLPQYLADDRRKTDRMRRARFGVRERLEMAASWAVPSGLVLGVLALALKPSWMLPLLGLCASLAVSVFLFYDRIPGPRRLLFGGSALAVALPVVLIAGGGGGALLAAAGACVLLTGVLTFDYTGSTPIEGSSHFEERRWRITLDLDRCRGVYSCWEVCPEACFEKREDVRKIDLAHDDRCVLCGACIVQCPKDAL
ncbi:MAG: 4Fe-4S binding protein [Deltaproteobacteria bacterium]|nr:4Fe-4S binding protein [Deltaproteobacteria bacterium]